MAREGCLLHVVFELLQVITLLIDLPLQFQELLVLTLADGVILIGLFALGEGVSGRCGISFEASIAKG